MIDISSGIVAILALLTLHTGSVAAFSSLPLLSSATRSSSSSTSIQKETQQQQQQQPGSRLFASASDSDDNEKGKLYPAMSQEEITKWMADIPVYAITSKSQLGGIVLLKDADNTAAAYYFINQDVAKATLAQMQRSTKNNKNDKKGDWQITPFSLGMIWFDVLFKPDDDDSIVHRLVADSRDLAAAREHVEQFATADNGGNNKKFQTDSFNEIPIFMDLQMRIMDPTEGKSGERFPMYLSVRDMVKMCQDFMETSNPDYEASVNIADLRTLVDQMKEASTVNFREALLVGPTPPIPPKGFVTAEEDGPPVEEEPYVPMNTDW